MNNKFTYLKILVLIAALFGIFYVINHLSEQKVAAGMQQIGIAPVAAPGAPPAVPTSAPVAGSSDNINLCPTRIRAIVWPDGRKLQETSEGLKRKWQAFNLTPVDIGYMDVEKWLSLHCSVPVDSDRLNPDDQLAPLLTIEYIDGSKEILSSTNTGHYRLGQRSFASSELTSALADLVRMAGLLPKGP